MVCQNKLKCFSTKGEELLVGPLYGYCCQGNMIKFVWSLFCPPISGKEKSFIRLSPEESRVKCWQSWFESDIVVGSLLFLSWDDSVVNVPVSVLLYPSFQQKPLRRKLKNMTRVTEADAQKLSNDMWSENIYCFFRFPSPKTHIKGKKWWK